MDPPSILDRDSVAVLVGIPFSDALPTCGTCVGGPCRITPHCGMDRMATGEGSVLRPSVLVPGDNRLGRVYSIVHSQWW